MALILEATAQILEAGGLPAFTTNAVAERAGVSIGTLYQYFADKNAILLALARQQMTIGLASIGRALQGESDPSVEGRVRAKDGSIAGVNSLSGFIERPDGKVWTFSVQANHHAQAGRAVVQQIDGVVVEMGK